MGFRGDRGILYHGLVRVVWRGRIVVAVAVAVVCGLAFPVYLLFRLSDHFVPFDSPRKPEVVVIVQGLGTGLCGVPSANEIYEVFVGLHELYEHKE